MKTCLLILSLLLTGRHAVSQPPAAYEAVIHSNANIRLHRAVATRDGGMLGAGRYSGSPVMVTSYLVKTDSLGKVAWSNLQLASGNIAWSGLGLTGDGGCVLSGSNEYPPSPVAMIGRVRGDGSTAWIRSVPNGSSGTVALEQGGSCLFAGSTTSEGLYFIKTDSNGSRIWSHFYEYPGLPLRLGAVTPGIDGGYFLTGTVKDSNAADILVIKADSLGQIVTMALLMSVGGHADLALYGEATPDGGVLLAGSTAVNVQGDSRALLMKLSVTGLPVMAKAYELSGGDVASGVAQCSDGGYLLCGTTSRNLAGAADGFLIRTDDTGAVRWTRLTGGSDDDGLVAVASMPEGSILLAGNSSSFSPAGTGAAYFLKLDSAGRQGCHGRDTLIAATPIRFTHVPLGLPRDNTAAVTFRPFVTGPVYGGMHLPVCDALAVPKSRQSLTVIATPNPATTALQLEVPGALIGAVTVINSAGSAVYRASGLKTARTSVDLRAFPAGAYFYSVVTPDGATFRGAFVVRR